ncbi:MAG: hypothetical protein SPI25_02370 [Dialister sp.]|nr:hypothetical protein [Dialister sp.]
MIEKIWLPLTAVLMTGSFALAAAPEGNAKIISNPAEIEQSSSYGYSYTSTVFSEDPDIDSSTTMYMDDGYGRLTTFEVVKTGSKATITIRQSGAIRWQGSVKARTSSFGVTRRTEGGGILFKITIGEHTLYATVNTDDVWVVTEQNGNPRDPVPLAAKFPAPADTK